MTGPRLMLLCSLLICLGCSGREETPVFGPGPGVWADHDPAWTVVHPANGTERLLAACAVASGEAWVVGTGGVVLHHVGRRWLREESGTDATLADVATDGRLVCAVGSGGTIIVSEGGGWRREASPAVGALLAVAVMADGEVWAGGERGALLRRTEAGWRHLNRRGSATVTALVAWGDTLVVGAGGAVFGVAGERSRCLGSFAGGGPLQLAVSPSGTLFAAADSLYRYDSGRWTALRRNTDLRLAANDSLVFSGGLALRHDGAGSWQADWYSIPWRGRELAAVCSVGPAGALAVGMDGAFSWLGNGVWRGDLDGGYTGEIVALADGTVCSLSDGRVIAWDDDHWRVILVPAISPSDTMRIRLVDGLDRSHLLLEFNSGWLSTGARGQTAVAPPPDDWLYQTLIAPDGGLVAVDFQGLIAWNGQEWCREYITPSNDHCRFTLTRNRGDGLFAINNQRVLRRDEGRWREVAQLSEPSGWHSSDEWFLATGGYPNAFAVLSEFRWLQWDARADSVQSDWRAYDPTNEERWASAICEAAGTAYMVVEQTHRVLRLRLAGPDAGSWETVAGPLPDPVTALRIEPDGSITAFATSTGRVWRHPAPPFL